MNTLAKAGGFFFLAAFFSGLEFATLPTRADEATPAPVLITAPPASQASAPGYNADPGPIMLPPPTHTVKMKPELMGVHPRIYLKPGDIAAFEEKIKNPIVAPMWEDYLHWIRYKATDQPPAQLGSEMRDFGDKLPAMALAYLVSKDPVYLAGVRKWIQALVNYPTWQNDDDLGAAHALFGIALAYDWLYSEFTPDERKVIEDTLTRHSRLMLKRSILDPGSWWGSAYFQNHCWINHTGIALAAMVTYEINPAEKQTWLDYTRTVFQPTHDYFDTDSSYHEGPAYMSYGTEWFLYYIEALKSFSGEDLSDMPYLKNLTKGIYDTMMPDWTSLANFGDTPPDGWDPIGESILPWLAAHHQDGHAEWLRRKNFDSFKLYTPHHQNPMAMLWFDPTVQPIPPDDLPTLGFYPDLGLITFRTSWKPDAAMVAFHCGPPGGLHVMQNWSNMPHPAVAFSHSHPDAGSFLFWTDGQWRIGLPGAYTHDKKTHDENVWLVNGKGQRGEAMWFEADSYVKAPAQAHIVTVATSDQADYVVGEAAPAYDPNAHLTSWQRHLLFVKAPKPYVVAYDTLTADQPVDWTSYLHTYEAIQVMGNGQFQAAAPTSPPSSPTSSPTYGVVLGPANLTPKTGPLMVLDHEEGRIIQKGYELSTPSPKGTSTWQVTVVTTVPTPVKLAGQDPGPSLSVGTDEIKWAADGTVSLNGKALAANHPLP
jgi:hypothetical protein